MLRTSGSFSSRNASLFSNSMTPLLIVVVIFGLTFTNLLASKKLKQRRQGDAVPLNSREIGRILLESLKSVLPTTEQMSRAPEPKPRRVPGSKMKHPQEKGSKPRRINVSLEPHVKPRSSIQRARIHAKELDKPITQIALETFRSRIAPRSHTTSS